MKNIFFPVVLFISAFFAGFSCVSDGPDAAGDMEEEKQMDSIFNTLPASLGLVNDFENILSPEEEKKLGEHIKRINEGSAFELVVATCDSIGSFEDIMSYATALGNKWQVGDAEENNGLVIVVSSKLGQAAIATGNGVEGIFTDEVTQQIIDERMIPHFIRSDFYAGLERALREVDRLAAKPAQQKP